MLSLFGVTMDSPPTGDTDYDIPTLGNKLFEGMQLLAFPQLLPFNASSVLLRFLLCENTYLDQ